MSNVFPAELTAAEQTRQDKKKRKKKKEIKMQKLCQLECFSLVILNISSLPTVLCYFTFLNLAPLVTSCCYVTLNCFRRSQVLKVVHRLN